MIEELKVDACIYNPKTDTVYHIGEKIDEIIRAVNKLQTPFTVSVDKDKINYKK